MFAYFYVIIVAVVVIVVAVAVVVVSAMDIFLLGILLSCIEFYSDGVFFRLLILF